MHHHSHRHDDCCESSERCCPPPISWPQRPSFSGFPIVLADTITDSDDTVLWTMGRNAIKF